MKQILQNLGNGETILAEIPVPAVSKGQILIRSQRSLVSIGTERMLVDFGRANLLDKARQQPAKVAQVLAKIKTDGLMPTLDAVRSKLDQPIPLGYSNAGIVVSVGAGVRGFQIGDRVISNGPHSEYVVVPENLCAKIPDSVSLDEAAFTVIASIALQGTRLVAPTFGETFVVTGLGLIGLITTQILLAQGCHVIGIDYSTEKCERAASYGAHVVDLSQGGDPVATAMKLTNEHGVDGVLVTASSKSNEPMHQAALMCRKRGRIILVGVTGLELSREDFYEKELSFQVSCSYGPGRYDDVYEQQGIDYPIGFVRWTEQRNFQAILDGIASGRLDLKGLITHRFPFDKAVEAYGPDAKGALGLVLEYPDAEQELPSRVISLSPGSAAAGVQEVGVGLIGAGGFTSLVMLPALQSTGARLRTIASSKGITSTHLGKKFGFEQSTTDLDLLFNDSQTNTVFVTTRHDSHSRLVERALKSGKRVFVEKPLAITREELESLKQSYQSVENPFVMVGFNRRFSPLSIKARQLLSSTAGPKSVVMMINAGAIPANNWNHDPAIGGGRIIGEGCHFVDLARYLVGSAIVKVQASSAHDRSGNPIEDESTINLSFEDGSMATIHYLASGHKGLAKERIEVFVDGKVLQLDNFRALTGFGWNGFNGMKLKKQDKGHFAEVAEVVDRVRKGTGSPIPWNELLEVTEAVFDAVDQIRASR